VANSHNGHACIQRIKVSNYRSLGESVELNLEPLTVLVGINGSGKSNVADVFRFLSECLRHGLETALLNRQGIGAVRRWSAGRPFDLTIHVDLKFEDRDSSYEFILGGATAEDFRVKRERIHFGDKDIQDLEVSEGKIISAPSGLSPHLTETSLVLPLISSDSRVKPIADALRSLSVYAIFPDQLRKPQVPSPEYPMDEHGQNWTSILRSSFKKGPRKSELCAALHRLTGDIADITVKQVGRHLVAQFKHDHEYDASAKKKREKWFDAALESDGTLRMAGILTALLQEPTPALIGIEEPELTIHAGMLPLLYDYLSEASIRSQIVITTHSPDFLGLCPPESIRVVEKIDGVTSINPMLPGHIDAVKKKLLTIDDLLRSQALGGHAGAAGDAA